VSESPEDRARRVATAIDAEEMVERAVRAAEAMLSGLPRHGLDEAEVAAYRMRLGDEARMAYEEAVVMRVGADGAIMLFGYLTSADRELRRLVRGADKGSLDKALQMEALRRKGLSAAESRPRRVQVKGWSIAGAEVGR